MCIVDFFYSKPSGASYSCASALRLTSSHSCALSHIILPTFSQMCPCLLLTDAYANLGGAHFIRQQYRTLDRPADCCIFAVLVRNGGWMPHVSSQASLVLRVGGRIGSTYCSGHSRAVIYLFSRVCRIPRSVRGFVNATSRT